MKLFTLIFLCVMCHLTVFTQTPEQKKQMQEAKRKADSIMNLPHVKEMMKEAKAREEEFDKLEKERKAKEKLKPKTNKKVKSQTPNNSVNEFYWRNTIASNTNGHFKDWTYGTASLRVAFFDRKARAYVYLPFGSISKEGQISIVLPSVDEDKAPFKLITKDYSEGEGLFYYDHLQFSDDAAKWMSTRFTLEVHQGETVLGTLKIGNAIKPVVNLNSPCCIDKAGDGYALSWVYITTPNSIKGEISAKNNGKISHNMSFKKGWNLIKIQVSGTAVDQTYNTELWVNKSHTVENNLPEDAKYYFLKH